MIFKIFINGVCSDERALVNMDTKEVIFSGNWHFDNICNVINGFFVGLLYGNTKYKLLNTETIMPDNKMFDICNFLKINK